jgi:Flp pilus assembly protein TadD
MITQDPLALTADATLLFTQEDNKAALEKLAIAISIDSSNFHPWLAQAEIYYGLKNFDNALTAAETAQKINPEDVHVHTTLSRIWIQKNDKDKAEKFSRRARMLGWKEQIRNKKKACQVCD